MDDMEVTSNRGVRPNLYSTGRTILHKVVPLKQPFSLLIFPSMLCNFRCEYCSHYQGNPKLDKEQSMMSFQTFQKIVDGMAKADWRLKKMMFSGGGEPLLNKDIARMVAYAKGKGVTDRVEIFTNGSLLTSELSDALIDADLDQLRISIQGISAEQYMSTSKVKIDFNQLVQQLEYFQSHKIHTRTYLKTLDYLLPTEEDEKTFRSIYKNAADIIAVECVHAGGRFTSDMVSGNSLFGENYSSKACPRAFLGLTIYSNGDVKPCNCPSKMTPVIGSLNNMSIEEIWNSKDRRHFWLQQLEGADTIPFCRNCASFKSGVQYGDSLDGHEDEIRQRILALEES